MHAFCQLESEMKLLTFRGFWLGREGQRVEHDGSLGFKERPAVVDRHRAVVDDVDVACDLGVVQDAAKVDLHLLEGQVGEVNLSSQTDVVLQIENHLRVILLLVLLP